MTDPPSRVARVLPDVPAIDKEFDYLVPDAVADRVGVGAVVRIDLHGRRVGGWVVADDVTPPVGLVLRPLARITGWGPSPEVVELAGWAAWRWAGRRAALLKSASAPGAVAGLPPPGSRRPAPLPEVDDVEGVEEAFTSRTGRSVLRVPPAQDLLAVVLAAAGWGPALVVTPSASGALEMGLRLRRAGLSVAVVPREWAQAAAGVDVVIGARAAAWAPCPRLAAVVVLDGHDEALQQEQAPTWNAWIVAAERAHRKGVPCVITSPCPSVELLAWAGVGAGVVAPSRTVERAGWAALEVIDRRREDPHTGLYSPRLVGLLRGSGRVICVLNRKGRARLLACTSCGELVRCEKCGAALGQASSGTPPSLVCARCGTERPPVCLHCGSIRLKTLRLGVSRVREELEALAGRAVGEVTAETKELPDTPVLVGTEAVLHRVGPVDGVAFLDFDQELLAPRYRAGEEALVLLARASRLVGGRRRGGRVLVQTRVPHHEVLTAAVSADPARFAVSEAAMRVALGLPPARVLALVSGPVGEPYVDALRAAGDRGVEITGPEKGRWLLRADDHDLLCGLLASVARPPGRLRVEVDPLRA